MSETQSGSKNVPLGDLIENDYNPRGEIDAKSVESLRESITSEGLIQALTVRPRDGKYEVISGTRRLYALRDLYDDDHEVPVNVRDVNDRKARLMALAENIEREDLPKMAEARAFAREVNVRWCEDCGAVVQDNHAESEAGKYHEVNRVPYVNMVKSGTQAYQIAQSHPDVKALAESIDRSASYIRDHLSFLTLPEEAWPMINSGDLTVRAARMMARIDIDNPRARMENLRDLINQFGGRENGLSDDDYEELKAAIENRAENWQRLKELKTTRLQEIRELIHERAHNVHTTLEDTVEWFNEHHAGELLEIETDEDDLVVEIEGTQALEQPDELSEWVEDLDAQDAESEDFETTLQDYVSALDATRTAVVDRLNERNRHLKQVRDEFWSGAEDLGDQIDRLKKTADRVGRESQKHCPWCHSEVSSSDLDDRISDYETRQRITEAKAKAIPELREGIEDRTQELQHAMNQVRKAQTRLDEVHREIQNELQDEE